jgi:PAS domain S-box-containing protein
VPITLTPSRLPWWLIVVFIGFATVLGGLGRWQFLQQRDWLTQVGRRAMAAATASRVTDLVGWREERVAAGAALRANRQFATLSAAAVEPAATPESAAAWTALLDVVLTRRDHVGALLLSPDGNCRRAVGASSCGEWAARSATFGATWPPTGVGLSDPFPAGDRLHVLLWVPVADGRNPIGRPAAVAAIEVDAQPGLLSLLGGRGGPTQGSRFLLVRRESDGITVLAAEGQGLPATGAHLPGTANDAAVGRIVRGEEGLVDAVADSGAPSVSVARRVGDSDWWVLATLTDLRAEVQLATEARNLTALVTLLVLTAAAALALMWQRRQAALYRELYETEARRKVLAESFGLLSRFANDIIVFADETGRMVEVNDRALEAYGYPRDQMLGRPFSMLRAPDIRSATDNDFERLKMSGSVAYQGEHVRKDGTPFPVDVRARYYVQGGQGYAIGIIRDMSERVALERRLRDTAETYRQLFEGASDAIVVGSAETGLIIDANQKAAALVGRSVEWLRGQHHTVLHPPDHEETSRGNFRKRAELDSFETIETFMQHADGHRIPVEVNASRIDLHGRPAVLGIFRDQTERLQREQELFASESRRQKLESLALLAGGIAHDFNNLLTTIVGNISLAGHSGLLPPDIVESLGAAENASLRAKELTRQLLTFSKGGAPIKKVTDLTLLVREAVAFACHGTAVATDFVGLSAAVMAEVDEGQITQVVNNIVINAVQAMPTGGRIRAAIDVVALTTDNPEHLPPGRYAKLTFTDTGVGIPPELQARVFDPYFTTKQQGSGLGLAISHSIVARHGGSIAVRSELGAGTTFDVLLPASDARPRATPRLTEPPEGWRGRALVMDDEPDVRALALRMLERLGIAAEGVEDGAAAIRAYRTALDEGRRFDVVIMDLTVSGGMGGREATTALLGIDPGAAVVVSSGYSNDPIMGSFREYGFRAVLTKPYTVSEMRGVLGAILGPAPADAA